MPSRYLHRFNRFAAAALAAVNLPRPPRRPESIAGDWDYLKAHMQWFIRRNMRKAGVPGLSIALVDDQKLVWAEGFGYADRALRAPATAETLYQIGSITKVLNAIAILQQAEAGRIDLDRPFSDYLPQFSMQTRWPDAAPITARALLCHHAGLPTYYLKGFFSDDSLETLLAQLKDEHFSYEPHTVFNYSNIGSNLLGLALARITGLSYEEALTKNLLAPLGMLHTAFHTESRSLARGYVYDRAVDPTPIRDLPAGGLYSNVIDLSRFIRFVFADGSIDGRTVLGAETLHASLVPQYPDLPLDFGQRFGLGWMLSGLPIKGGGRQAWHNGGTKAFLSQMALLPDKKLGVVVIANADCAGNVVYEAAEEALKLALEVRDGITQPPKVLAPEISLPRETLAGYVGDYSLMGSLA
ncbi:MAG: beta-lactamase family protein, partial [Gammaproteobacteria bacterium]|nr:beta-lactamase family protein [Gammaproteobacteria bacterium]